jgi:putative GTP pyrophosphokinase
MDIPDKNQLRESYEANSHERSLLTQYFGNFVEKLFSSFTPHPMIKVRAKSFESYFEKYIRYLRLQSTNSRTVHVDDKGKIIIPDEIGVRIICIFLEDIDRSEQLIKDNLDIVEIENKGASFSFKEFGYISVHILAKMPQEVLKKVADTCGAPLQSGPAYVEVQIRTILQDAWAEVEHELVYKANFVPFEGPIKRKLAALNASLSLADTIFQEIRVYQRQLNKQLEERRDTFYKKVEDSTEKILDDKAPTDEAAAVDDILVKNAEAAVAAPNDKVSVKDNVDDLLLNGLYAHNKGNFAQAIQYYTRILELHPTQVIMSMIYKHRGMAYFACSNYKAALTDFSRGLEIDPTAYRIGYYRGVVNSVLGRYSDALDDFNQSLSVNPYQHYCLYRRAQAYYHLEDYPAALADCEAAITLSTDFPAAQKLRAMLLEKLKM